MSNSNGSIVIAKNLYKQYKQGDSVVSAVDNLSVEIPKGKLIVLMGHSGSGKTTFLNLMGALDKPTSGNIIVDGVNLSQVSGRQESKYRLSKVGFVFQSYYLVPGLKAIENVTLPMELSGLNHGDRQVKAREILNRVGIKDLKQSRRPLQLSGGEQQRVAIARALANAPPIILADEPTGNLDFKTGKLIVKILQSLAARDNKTVIIATHDTSIAKIADLVLQMEDGKLVIN
ncbi:MAG: ABC transporter ATP-binding protein [Chloroflexi bacterium]|jgi:putative ABC transport system ATP-binding protein|nr:ABC transporter ATP-binding protein [Chloroflexota bacterium]MBT7080200.1 ABC transporter ATP-binding protein [Chloroflexota bacterium]MBT7290146.1 ABC transporter ATP-binding protein [Chloroflexota bacterium]